MSAHVDLSEIHPLAPDVVPLFDQGVPIRDIAGRLNTSQQTINRVLARLRKREVIGRRYSEDRGGSISERVKAFIAEREQGKTLAAIGAQHGVTPQAVYYAVSRWSHRVGGARDGVVTLKCLRCGTAFGSPDRCRVRICSPCKDSGEW